ncbi:multifunctional oxoglutarate decarboxylase/oxoglutarate dehydrogenase thiamine pyrophosphate-binding subunit/dihydrolipoyllysine-residue succinyltransferase subunit [Euzebya sp.]|uniref:multifunctional oxoglutarate decarboxylase/oxoglutarate dehydrogenase thiamine pyrophosphate-binding subunit/dihydrolipoyllysine-residue succinyltransferase subunit n=1 Tax=Euzebya sp. TaxID=1971409 RepID=UPI0035162119
MAESPTTFGANAWIVEELYRDFLTDPSSVPESWHDFFSDYVPPHGRTPTATSPHPASRANGASGNGSGGATAVAEAPSEAPEPAPEVEIPDGAVKLRGVAAAIAENMETSLTVPTATSLREVPAKLLEVNRRILNNQLGRTRGGKVSFTHLIGWAMVKAIVANPAMKTSYHVDADGTPYAHRPEHLNLGLAVDVERKGGRVLLVPNIKDVDAMSFAEYWRAYEEMIRRVHGGNLSPDMFEGTTATLTNPGGLGTVGSVPRLMKGQSAIIGVGAIDYPSQFKGSDPRTLADLGIGKVITMTSTYDHRVIQGAESGMFLGSMEANLLGEDGFYDEIFDSLKIPYEPVRWRTDNSSRVIRDDSARAAKQIAVQKLTNMYRVRGHLIANLNPLQHTFRKVHPELDPATYGLTIWDLDREFHIDGIAGRDRMALGGLLGVLRDAYCRTVGIEYMHISDPEQKTWFQERLEGKSIELSSEDQKRILTMLNEAEAFERFLGTKYLGQKRFSLEGSESLIPMLDALLTTAVEQELSEAVIGMAHRGRLNVLANILGKSYDKIFSEFEGDISPDTVQGSGDVKYHLGARGVHHHPDGGRELPITLAANPSHLEAVDPVVEGMARAKQDQLGEEGFGAVLPILIHGDAAFAGQGVVAETLGMSQLKGYATGGTIHLIVNNQLGFTTAPHHSRSSEYATDIAKMVSAPIIHVNGDDPEACVRVVRLAMEYRQRFGRDVVVDMICYRRHGHNEGDEPAFTQPIMYEAIEQRRSVRKVYTEELVNRGDLTLEEAESALEEFRETLESALTETRESKPTENELPPPPTVKGVLDHVDTGVSLDRLQHITKALTSWPEDFQPHPKLAKMLAKRADLLGQDAVDWPMAEMLALGTLLQEGVPVRFAGQDSRRGTFSQRHSVLVDHTDASEHLPLRHLEPLDGTELGAFMIYDSPLHEFGALGFEYGYAVARPEALTVWEAQVGDFSNGAQVIIDQFITAAEDKWGERSRLVILLPHGYEGQGPEHSSARIERWLTLCAQDNIQVAQPTTAAQHFHLLRRQMHRDVVKPLVVFSPKSMLRAKHVQSAAADFTDGSFAEVLVDAGGPSDDEVRRVVVCSGKVRHDLIAARDEREAPAKVISLEQLYPFPQRQLEEALGRFEQLEDVMWVQDEPENMGPWPFVGSRLYNACEAVGEDVVLKRATRFESASPATGSHTVHDLEQDKLMDDALAGL